MTSFFFNEAVLRLPDVASVVDRSRQFLEVVTEDGAAIDLLIARAKLPEKATLRSAVDADLAEHQRSLHGFQLLSKEERTYEALTGIEVRIRFIDKARGPAFHHEFHSLIGDRRIGFHGIAKMGDADACDAWMRATLASMTLRR